MAEAFAYILAGGGLGWAFARLTRGRTMLSAGGLMLAALVYLAFALVNGAAVGWVFVEAGGVVLFAGMATLGLRRSARRTAHWLAAGWGLHAFWDAVLHMAGPGTALVPAEYVLLCTGFDLAVAARLAAEERRRTRCRQSA